MNVATAVFKAKHPDRRRDERDLTLTLACDHIKGVLVSIAYGLAELRQTGSLDDLVAEVADVLRHRLDREQRGLMLVVCAQAAEPAYLEALAEAVVAGQNVLPVLPFDDIRAEAADWAAFASRRQVRAIIAASLAVLPAKERRELLAAASRRVPS